MASGSSRHATYRCMNCGREGSYFRSKGIKTERCRLAGSHGMKCLGVLELVDGPAKLVAKGLAREAEEAAEQKPPTSPVEEEQPMNGRAYRRAKPPAEEEESFPEHPLFPLTDDGEPFEITFIQLTRWENGKLVWGPVFPANELETELAITEMFGGGQYVLQARRAMRTDSSKPGSVTKSRKITLPGRPKPFSSDPTEEEAAAHDPSKRIATAQENGGHAGSFQGSGGFEQVLLAMMSMQQQTAERAAAENRESARREAENSKAFMTMFLGMMNASKADTSNMMQMMMQLSSQQQTSMVQLLPALIGARGGGPEEMAKFAELFKALGFAQSNGKATGPKDDDNSIGAILSNGADILQGFLALKGGGLGAPAIAGDGSAPAAAPAGSAAEMLERMKRGG